MEIVRGLEDLKPGIPSVVTVGVFDGVHLGHKAIMQAVKATADEMGARSVAVTFDRNPEELVKSIRPQYITTLEQKLALIGEQGIDLAVVLLLEKNVLDMTAEEFIEVVIHERLSATHVVVGANFVFGKGRGGDARLLRRMGEELGFEVAEVPPVCVGDIRVSSTAIRGLLADGKIEQAEALLGRPFLLEGIVVPGRGIGRSLGFPTANIEPAEGQIVPSKGVYAVLVVLDGVRYTGVSDVGIRPTVGGGSMRVEVYMIGFSGELYGRRLEVSFHHRLRDEVRFEDTEALKKEIQHDVGRAIRLLG
jgi:riboflavin kinase/FMN adenylyltransferase